MRSRPAALAALVLLGAARAGAAPLAVYTDDALAPGFASWSWAAVDFAYTPTRHAGTSSVRTVAGAWEALFVHREAGIDTLSYGTLDFWILGTAGQSVVVTLNAGGAMAGAGRTHALSGAWQHASYTFEELGVTAGTAADGFWIQDANGAEQTFYVDDVQILERGTPPPPPAPVTVTVDPAGGRRTISPGVYGVNFGDDAQAARLRWPVRRWGGNSTSRYNWQTDTHAVGADWFYFNYNNLEPAPPSLPDGSSADRFVDATRASGGEPIVTVPLIGWTPLDRVRRWSFPVSVYGAQQKTECTATNFVSWCNPDAGNGVRVNGTPITADPARTSMAIGPSFVTAWQQHIAARVGDAAHGGVRLFALDNEPALWNSTHRDVHPQPTTYDELWSQTVAIGGAMKALDPGIRLLGPVSWGWCEYFYSAADGCDVGPDRAAHGGLPWIDWYLAQAKQYELDHGVRLVDYLDLHYYPQNDGVFSDDESAGTAATRLRSLRSLYDASYTDESWTHAVVRLIPRMRDWVATRYPGTRLALTEYSWGGDDGPTSALAQAEALAIFGREGLDLATRWVAPAPGTRVEDAFRLYLDWNGTGGRLVGDSIAATSSDVDAVGSYAIEGPDGRRAFLLFNKDTRARHATVRLAGGALVGEASLTRFDASRRFAFAGNLRATAGALELDLPARSATLAVVEAASASPAARFYTVTPCRVLDTRNAAGPYGGPALAANVPRAFVFGGRCGIPMDAVAVSANLTATGAAAAGSVRAYAADRGTPSATVLSFDAEATRADNAVVALSRDGRAAVALYAPAGVHVIVDVNGYFR